MSAAVVHEGAASFLNRALYFAQRGADESPRDLQMPVTWLAYFLLYRAGCSADEIAAMVEVGRRHIVRRLWMVIMALLANDATRARLDALAAEMGRVRFADASAEVIPFGGPSRLSQRTTEASS